MPPTIVVEDNSNSLCSWLKLLMLVHNKENYNKHEKRQQDKSGMDDPTGLFKQSS